MNLTGLQANGQLIAAVVALVDAIFGLLFVLGYVHVRPDDSIVAAVVTIAFNSVSALLAYMQHSSNQTALKMGLLPGPKVAGK